MEFTQQNASKNSVISMDDSSISLSHMRLQTPCFISANKSQEISISTITEINKELLFELSLKDPLDLLIIGTGKKPIFLSPKQQVELSEIGIGVECMNNSSASSSFNLLLCDLRKVGLLIL